MGYSEKVFFISGLLKLWFSRYISVKSKFALQTIFLLPKIAYESKLSTLFRQKKKCLAFAKHLLLVGMSGLEPPTPTLSGWCSNRLSYIPSLVEIIGFEPMTPCLQGRCSSQLSYTPKRCFVILSN